MSTAITPAITPEVVNKAKNKLQNLFERMRPPKDNFYTLIKQCFDLFWVQYHKDWGWASHDACDPKPMEDTEVINIIREKFMPRLREAKLYINPNSGYFEEFNTTFIFFVNNFDNYTQPPSNQPPSNQPPSNKVLNSEKSEHEHAYDMNCINIFIATLQKQMSVVPSILQRLDNLEAKVARLHEQPQKPPETKPENETKPRQRLGTFPEKDPFSNSNPSNPRSDMHQQASVDTILQKISALETDV
jgi:hypothetical protein